MERYELEASLKEEIRMERYELEASLKEEIRAGVFGAGFMKLVQSVRRGGGTFKIAIRPVEIGGARRFQAEMTEDGRTQAKNFDADGLAEGLEEVIAQKGARELHLMTAKGDLHVRVTKKGRVLVSRSAPMDRRVELKPHDRVKNLPLNAFESTALLKAVGLADGEGRIRASMRGKYDQVNEFLRVLGETVGPCAKPAGESQIAKSQIAKSEIDESEIAKSQIEKPPFVLVDCGCGKAYLTVAAYFYLTEALGYPDVRVVGVDRRADVVAAARKVAAQLDVAERVQFAEQDLAAFTREDLGKFTDGAAPTLVCSLHACDTATDEALAKGVEWKARYILSAPCCQHELQKALAGGERGTGAFAGLLRQGILRERLCDLLTDAFRAMILRILGFKTQVIEFVSGEATARNVMLKAEWGVKCGQPGPVGEYLDLRDYWRVTPWLEARLKERLAPFLARYAAPPAPAAASVEA